MIDILLTNDQIVTVRGVDEIVNEKLEFRILQFHNHTQTDLDWLKQHFDLDASIITHYEDIEISSHFIENDKQVSIHFSILYYNEEKQIVEEPMFIIISGGRLFFFEGYGFDKYINETYAHKLSVLQQQADVHTIFKLYIEFLTDYYADITENMAKRIKVLANKVLVEKRFNLEEMDTITQYSFNNLLIKESLNETIRVYSLIRKSNYGQESIVKDSINTELRDLAVVSDYIQFNFERLNDLKDNINNKIDLEQNHIFKIFTVVTVCIALPTLIAGIYGMNFEAMPELGYRFGYPLTIVAMILSIALPLVYFKKKNWLK